MSKQHCRMSQVERFFRQSRNKLNMLNLFRLCRKNRSTGSTRQCRFDSVASTLLLVWTGLNTNVGGAGGMWHRPVGSSAVGCSSRADAAITFCCIHRSSDSQYASLAGQLPKLLRRSLLSPVLPTSRHTHWQRCVCHLSQPVTACYACDATQKVMKITKNEKTRSAQIINMYFNWILKHQVVKEFWQKAASHVVPLLRIGWSLSLCTPHQIQPMHFSEPDNPKKWPIPVVISTPSLHGSLGLCESAPPNRMSIFSAVFVGLPNVNNRHIDRPCYTVSSIGHIY